MWQVRRVCEICGRDAPTWVFYMPIKKCEFALDSHRQKVVMSERVEPANVNLCDQHREALTSIFEIVKAEYMKG